MSKSYNNHRKWYEKSRYTKEDDTSNDPVDNKRATHDQNRREREHRRKQKYQELEPSTHNDEE